MDSPLRRPWLSEVLFIQEDDAIVALVDELGDHQWRTVASKLKESFGIKGRSGKQCRERWMNHLDPKIKDIKWTDADEIRLFELHREHGNSWTEIAKVLNQTDNAVKNHFYSSVRRNIRDYNKVHLQKIPEGTDIKDVIHDHELSKEILKPNFHAKKRTKPSKDNIRRSDRNRKIVKYHIESSDDEQAPVFAKKRKPAPIQCPPPVRNSDIPSARSWTPSCFLFTPQSGRTFKFADEPRTYEGNCSAFSNEFDLVSPVFPKLPAFSPKHVL